MSQCREKDSQAQDSRNQTDDDYGPLDLVIHTERPALALIPPNLRIIVAEPSRELAQETGRGAAGPQCSSGIPLCAVLLTLGEVALMRNRPDTAEQRLTSVCQTNPRAVGGLFLLGYVQWKRGDAAGAKAQLERTRAALGPEWKPKGATAEGDVARRAHSEASPLSRFWENWDGALPPARSYAPLDAYLKTVPR